MASSQPPTVAPKGCLVSQNRRAPNFGLPARVPRGAEVTAGVVGRSSSSFAICVPAASQFKVDWIADRVVVDADEHVVPWPVGSAHENGFGSYHL
jgi:hypothetical protein